MKISQNFSLNELTKSDTAIRQGLENEPDQDQLISLTALVHKCLQPIRSKYEKVVTCTSGFRTPEVCKSVGSSSKSQHCRGEACDFEILGLDNKTVAQSIPDIVGEFDQLILEYYIDSVAGNSGWIHLSYNRLGSNRNECLRAVRKDGETKYEPWDLK